MTVRRVFSDRPPVRTVEQRDAAELNETTRQFLGAVANHIEYGNDPRWSEILNRLTDVARLARQMMHPDDKRTP